MAEKIHCYQCVNVVALAGCPGGRVGATGAIRFGGTALPIQNKVASHGGAASAGNTDTMVNIICGPDVGPFGKPPLFNFHIDTRTAARAAALAALHALKAANALAAANNDWSVAVRRRGK